MAIARTPVASAFLTDHGQTGEDIADLLAGFIAPASTSLDIAIYDLRLQGPPAHRLTQAVKAVAEKGVKVRVLFNVDHALPTPVPPPGQVDEDLVSGWGVPYERVSGVPALMHHKYVIRDALAPAAAVLTGSTNWTIDSWTREENVMVSVESAPLARCYAFDFDELWTTKDVRLSGHGTTSWSDLPGLGPAARVRAHFTPGHAKRLVHAIARRLHTAQRRVRILSPVITSGPVLGTLAEMLGGPLPPDLDLKGAFDATQMKEVLAQWREDRVTWKSHAFQELVDSGRFSSKVSTPYSQGSVHDFMHAKAVVTDDCVFVGSFNLSHSGESNAENVLEIESRAIADLFAAFADEVVGRYPRAG